MLPHHQQQILLGLARESVAAHLAGRGLPQPSLTDQDAALLRPSGAFVSVHRRDTHELRGCIGHLEATKPLWQTVQEMALACCFKDPRFSPVGTDEFQDLTFEISVLTSPQPVDDVSHIEVGRHGLIISRGIRRGVLLPQVARAEGWSREEFLDHTCLKAGLSREMWRMGMATIECFEAQVFSEETCQDHLI